MGRRSLEAGRALADIGTWLPLLVGQMRKLGVDSVPIALFIAVFTGIVLSLLSSYIFTGTVPLYFVGALVGKTIMMELGPVLTGMALAGRVGASIAAELGTMKVTEQVDALETLAYDRYAYLVVPRVLAATLMFPVVTAFAVAVGVASGWITAINLLDLSSTEFLKGLKQFYQFKDVWFGLVKSASFGGAVALMGCLRGLSAPGWGRRRGPGNDPRRGSRLRGDPGAGCLLGSRPAVILLDNLTKSFGPRTILNGVSLEVPDGQNTVIIGASGAGKSITLKLIVGLIEPDGGRVLVDDEVVQDLDRDGLAALRGRIGYVFQFAALFDSLTVAENIRLGLVKRGFEESTIRERIEESLAVVDLSGTEDKLPAELSGGMRKRVGIARAIALKPRYILYDEPTTGLDPITATVMDRLIIRTRDLGVTGLVVTHDMRSAFSVGDRVAMLYQGAIRQVGTVDEIQASDDPVVRQFIEGRPGPELVEPVARRSVG